MVNLIFNGNSQCRGGCEKLDIPPLLSWWVYNWQNLSGKQFCNRYFVLKLLICLTNIVTLYPSISTLKTLL